MENPRREKDVTFNEKQDAVLNPNNGKGCNIDRNSFRLFNCNRYNIYQLSGIIYS